MKKMIESRKYSVREDPDVEWRPYEVIRKKNFSTRNNTIPFSISGTQGVDNKLIRRHVVRISYILIFFIHRSHYKHLVKHNFFFFYALVSKVLTL